MGIEAAILNLVLYGLWVGLPLAVGVIVYLGGFLGMLKPSEDGTPSQLRKFLTIALIGATLTILLDVYFISSVGFRRFAYPHPWLTDLARVLLFPLSLLLVRALAVGVAILSPSAVDPRFQSEVKGISPLWAMIGFGLAIYSLSLKKESGDFNEQSFFAELGKASAVSNLGDKLGIDQPAQPIYSGVNYERFVDLIRDYALKHELPEVILVALVAEESNFNPDFRGVDGGAGLLNVTAGMARQVGVDNYLAPSENLEAGALVLKSLRDLFGAENERLWIAAYHFGTQKIKDNPELVEQEGEVKAFVDGVMRKARPE